MNFEMAFERVVGHEGNFQDDPNDRGNWTTGIIGEGQLKGTKFGISAMTYPKLDIKNLTLAQAKRIYKEDFWDRARLDQYDPGVAYQIFDAQVNHGPGNGIRFLQRAVKVVDDGDVGPKTLAAVREISVTDLVMQFNSQRLRFITKLQKFERYGAGWVNRVAGNLEYGAQDT
ncbi:MULTISPECIES: glycoside hydrolase family 108 protein [unclassified Pseudomonas]|uniref:glycoside hydrolase family 108 protein n=1 Tax=unclassified Pseudomonas TaxID=196821 RepID=UPI001C60861E|nr:MULTISPECIES: glycosyl hydrolase 108 family protein [unclassified Pseudomonas]MBW5416098.1 secretion activator protein [Pseudomonas sp. MAG002Y]